MSKQFKPRKKYSKLKSNSRLVVDQLARIISQSY